MDGNVSEWMHNFVEVQQRSDQFSIFGPNQGLRHLVKGGNYLSASRDDLEIRKVQAKMGKGFEIGFRLAKSI